MKNLKFVLLSLLVSTSTFAYVPPAHDDTTNVVWTNSNHEYIKCWSRSDRTDQCYNNSFDTYISINEYAGSKGFKYVYRHGLVISNGVSYIVIEVSKKLNI